MSKNFPHQWVLPDSSKPVNDLMFALTIIASIINTILLIRIYSSRKTLKVFHMSLVNMVVSDTLCGYISILFYGAHVLQSSIDYSWCYYSSTEFVSFLGLSISSATVISVERYFQIVVGKTASYKTMFYILLSLWVIHFTVGFYPLMVNMDIVSQPSGVYCMPDFRRNDLLHQSYSIVVAAFVISVLIVITVSYYGIWKKAVADGFKWNEKSFVIKNMDEFRDKPAVVHPVALNESDTKLKISDVSLQKPGSSTMGGSKFNMAPPELTFTSEVKPSSDESARSKQIAMTKKLAIITLELYLGMNFGHSVLRCIKALTALYDVFGPAWLGNLSSYIYKISTGGDVSFIWDSFMGIFHFCHCIFNPIIILTMDSRWKIWFDFLNRRTSKN
ncbi:hypothetical protein BKA69DRAFT_1141047 [Paraphysoderma sedebokerense]|nr:hypothetical protein BKA69DRAFT_1141047 [Paraphysoderma sedebokerense]